MALLSQTLIRKTTISTITRLVVTAASLALQGSPGARLDAPGARPVQRSSGIRRVAHEGPLLVSYVSDRPGRAYLDLALHAYQRTQRHSHCRPQSQGTE